MVGCSHGDARLNASEHRSCTVESTQWAVPAQLRENKKCDAAALSVATLCPDGDWQYMS